MALDSFVGDGLAPSPYKLAMAELRLQDEANDILTRRLDEAAAVVASLRAECERLRADAARYRWLRDTRLGQSIAYAIRWQGEGRDLYEAEADAAIDAALGKP